MNAYLVKRTLDEDQIPYDQYVGAVVVANTRNEAIELLRENCPEETWDGFKDVEVSELEVTAARPYIVLKDYKAG